MKQIEANSEEDVCLVLIGNKSDLEEDRCVTSEEGNALAKKYGMSFF